MAATGPTFEDSIVPDRTELASAVFALLSGAE
jgi:hypothetical protein